MLLALRSLYEPEIIVVPPTPGGFGPGFVVPLSIPVKVRLKSATGRFRAGKLTAGGGANIELFPVVGKMVSGIMEAMGAANVEMIPERAKARSGKLTATGIDNDPIIALSLLDL